MDTVNNHILLPFPPNWKARPDWSRRWSSEIAEGVLGSESRRALRAAPLRSLSFTVLARELTELTRLDDAILAAKKTGLACAPFHGRGYELAEDVFLDGAALTRNWSPAFASWLFLANSADEYEVREITDYAADALTFDDAVGRTYYAGTLCWPLIFGKFTVAQMAGRSGDHAAVKLTITELVSPLSVQLGEVTPPAGGGIGVMAIADDFQLA